MTSPSVIVDPEFAALIPPLTRDEDLALTESIRREGCRDALIVWESPDGPVLLDGHNRLRICTFDNLPYRIVASSVVHTRDEAVAWMIDNQLGRRNLAPDKASILRGELYNRSKVLTPFHGNQHTGGEGQNVPDHTAERLGAEYKVSPKTIKRDGQFAAATNTLAKNVGAEVKKAILAGDSPLPKRDIVAVAQASPERQKEVFAFKSKEEIVAAAQEIREEQTAQRRQARANTTILDSNVNDDEKKARAAYARFKEEREIGRVLGRVYLLSQSPVERAAQVTIDEGLADIFIGNMKEMADGAIEWLRRYSQLLGDHLGTPDNIRRMK